MQSARFNPAASGKFLLNHQIDTMSKISEVLGLSGVGNTVIWFKIGLVGDISGEATRVVEITCGSLAISPVTFDKTIQSLPANSFLSLDYA